MQMQKLKISLNSNQLLFVLVVLFTAGLFCLLSWLLPLRFYGNDDVGMCLIANGSYTATPDCHLIFINAIYGYILKILYSLPFDLEWYTILFSILHILSISIIAYYILTEVSRSKLVKIVSIIVLFIIEARLIRSFQWTSTAGLTCATGCLMLLKKLRMSKMSVWGGIRRYIIINTL